MGIDGAIWDQFKRLPKIKRLSSPVRIVIGIWSLCNLKLWLVPQKLCDSDCRLLHAQSPYFVYPAAVKNLCTDLGAYIRKVSGGSKNSCNPCLISVCGHNILQGLCMFAPDEDGGHCWKLKLQTSLYKQHLAFSSCSFSQLLVMLLHENYCLLRQL